MTGTSLDNSAALSFNPASLHPIWNKRVHREAHLGEQLVLPSGYLVPEMHTGPPPELWSYGHATTSAEGQTAFLSSPEL